MSSTSHRPPFYDEAGDYNRSNERSTKRGAKQTAVDFVMVKAHSQNRVEVASGEAVRTRLACCLEETLADGLKRKVYMVAEGEYHAKCVLGSRLSIMRGRDTVSIQEQLYTTVVNQRDVGFDGLQAIPLLKDQQPSMLYSYIYCSERDTALKSNIPIGTPAQHRKNMLSTNQQPLEVFRPEHTPIWLSTRVSISYVSDLLELRRVLSDAIIGNHSLSMKHILKRDMALGIYRIDLTVSPIQGMIIDLDHAKKREAVFRKTNVRTGTPAFMAAEQLDRTEPINQPKSEPDLAAVIANLGVLQPIIPIIASVTGHSEIHDMESFLWLLCYACIYYTGPAIVRDWTQESRQRRRAVWILFDAGAWDFCALRKSNALQSEDVFRRDVTKYFTPFFMPMHGLASAWRWVLYNAYMERDRERNIHQEFRDFIAHMERILPWHLARNPPLYALSEQLTFLRDERRVRDPQTWPATSSELQGEVKKGECQDASGAEATSGGSFNNDGQSSGNPNQ